MKRVTESGKQGKEEVVGRRAATSPSAAKNSRVARVPLPRQRVARRLVVFGWSAWQRLAGATLPLASGNSSTLQKWCRETVWLSSVSRTSSVDVGFRTLNSKVWFLTVMKKKHDACSTVTIRCAQHGTKKVHLMTVWLTFHSAADNRATNHLHWETGTRENVELLLRNWPKQGSPESAQFAGGYDLNLQPPAACHPLYLYLSQLYIPSSSGWGCSTKIRMLFLETNSLIVHLQTSSHPLKNSQALTSSSFTAHPHNNRW